MDLLLLFKMRHSESMLYARMCDYKSCIPKKLSYGNIISHCLVRTTTV